MATIDQIISVNITAATTAVATDSFAIPLIVGPTKAAVGAPESAVVTVDGAVEGNYALTVNGATTTTSAAQGDTQENLLNGILQALQATMNATGEVTGTGAAAKLTLAPVANGPLAVTGSDNLSIDVTEQQDAGEIGVQTFTQPSEMLGMGYTADSVEYLWALKMFAQDVRPSQFKVATRSASGSIVSDLAAISAIDDTWYCAIFPELEAADFGAVNNAFSGVTKIAGIAVETVAQAQAFAELNSPRVFQLCLRDTDKDIALAAWVGGQLPKRPGSSTWCHKQGKTVAAGKYTPSEASQLMGSPVLGSTGANCNIYQNVGGVDIFMPGAMGDGTFIDLRIGTDSLRSLIKTNMLQILIDNEKIPYTEAGCVVFESAIRAAIDTHVGYGFIDGESPVVITHVPVAQVSTTQRAQRIAPPFNFTCRSSSAQHSVVITGNVNI